MGRLTVSTLRKFCACGLFCLLGYVAQAQETFLDQFTTAAYNNTNGTQNWATNPWTETNDDNAANAGRILITGGALRVGSASAATAVDVSIQRSANLSSFTSGTLSFSILRTRIDAEADDSLVLEIINGSTTTQLAIFSSDNVSNTTAATQSYDISTYLTASTIIRFRVVNSFESNEYFTIDNVQISLPSANLAVTKTGTSSVTVNGTGTYSILPDLPYGYELTKPLGTLSLGFSQTIKQEDIGMVSIRRKK
jgi:hypothetical protein